jgi:hypothetical protein
VLQEVVWLCADVYEKRTWLPLLMGLDGRHHPLAHIKPAAPPPPSPPGGTAAGPAAEEARPAPDGSPPPEPIFHSPRER